MKRSYLIFLLILSLVLPSCAGIGDGALIGDIELEGERIVCTVEAYTGDNELLDSFKMDGAPANELFAYITEYEYDEQVIDSIMSDPYVVVSFERYNLKGDKLSDVDAKTGRKYQYRVTENDNAAQFAAEREYYESIGNASGLYQKIVELFNVRSKSNGYFCSVYSSEPYSAYVKAKADSGYSFYKLLTEAEYVTGLDRTANEKAFYVVGFNGATDKTYYIYDDDFVEELVWTAQGDDLYRGLGKLDGIYAKAQELFIESMEKVTNRERKAGVKLNCLAVTTKPGEYSRDDFADILCVYLKRVEGDHYLAFFNAVNEYELNQTLESLKAKNFVTDASTVGVNGEDEAISFER